MASTRNKNTIGNYSLEIRENNQFMDKMLYEHSAYGSQKDTYLSGDGVFSSKLPHTKLSYNATDIETYLRGTRATDLVNPNAAATFRPELKQLKSLCIYKKPKVVMPLPLVVEKHQRPNI